MLQRKRNGNKVQSDTEHIQSKKDTNEPSNNEMNPLSLNIKPNETKSTELQIDTDALCRSFTIGKIIDRTESCRSEYDNLLYMLELVLLMMIVYLVSESEIIRYEDHALSI